jgi:superfamily I DNA/RNA helicase
VAPADHEGAVFEADEIEKPISIANPNEDWLFIARTNYHAKRMVAALHAAGKPCRWVKSPDGATNRSEGLKALFALEQDRDITGVEWGKAIALLPTMNKGKEPILTRGTKTKWAKENADDWDTIFANDLDKVGAAPAGIEAIRSGKWCGLVDHGEQWRKQAVTWGADLAASPRIRVGTIHSVKGAEADNVAFLTTIGSRVEQGMENPDQADEEHRIAYVAVTRARRNLYVVNEGKAGRRVPRMEVL